MSATSYFRGHEIYYNFNRKVWYYSDTDEEMDIADPRPCKKCGKVFQGSNEGDADLCLGELPGVTNACCGHGVKEQSYICFENGLIIRGFEVDQVCQTKKK